MTTSLNALADQAATAVHQLAHLARPAVTPLDLDELRSITGSLADLAAAMPQTLSQLGCYLNPDGLAVTDGAFTGDPPAAVDQIHNSLRHASAAAAHLAAAVDAAHQTLGDLAKTTETKQRGSTFDRR